MKSLNDFLIESSSMINEAKLQYTIFDGKENELGSFNLADNYKWLMINKDDASITFYNASELKMLAKYDEMEEEDVRVIKQALKLKTGESITYIDGNYILKFA